LVVLRLFSRQKSIANSDSIGHDGFQERIQQLTVLPQTFFLNQIVIIGLIPNMAHIEISNLNSAGSDLFAGTDSFLTELQTTETTQIFGGSNHCYSRRRHGKKTSIKIRKPKTSYKIVSKCKPAPCFVPVKKWC
jgi:hypothetical protein